MSIVNVSLRTIANSLNTDEAGISWVIIAYLLTITSLMGLAGGLGDVYGRKKIFQVGMLIFSLGSLLCSQSTNLSMLVISRIIQAVGAFELQNFHNFVQTMIILMSDRFA